GMERNGVAALADLEAVHPNLQLIDSLPHALIGEELVISRHTYRTPIFQRHAIDGPLSHFCDDRGAVGREPPVVMFRMEIRRDENQVPPLLCSIEFRNCTQTLWSANPGLRSKTRRIVQEHVLATGIRRIDA